jgi:serine/threonine-protein kinase
MARPTLQLKLKANDLIGNRYVVLKKLGEGGCGSVYRARLVKDQDREVAIKVLENASDIARFRREAKVLRAANNIYVLKCLDQGVHDRHPYLVLEYMEGGSVRDLIDSRGRLSPEEAAWVLIMAVRGLRAARTLHRDLKPENLLVGRGSGGRLNLVVGDIRKGCVVKLADFGLAKAFDANNTRLTNTGQVMGTPLYMSPEQCRNMRTVNLQSDIYSLGVILYEMVVGKPPFDASNAYDIMAKHCNEEPKWPRALDPRVKAICERCLQKSPTSRYRSLIGLEKDLSALAGLDEPEPDRFPITWVVIITGLLALAGLVWLLHEQLWQYVVDWWRGK